MDSTNQQPWSEQNELLNEYKVTQDLEIFTEPLQARDRRPGCSMMVHDIHLETLPGVGIRESRPLLSSWNSTVRAD